jgi:hypothetical protein
MFMSFFFKKAKKSTNAVLRGDTLVVENDQVEETDQVITEEMDVDDNTMMEDDGHGAFNHAVVYSL